jgi:hypothetical protein
LRREGKAFDPRFTAIPYLNLSKKLYLINDGPAVPSMEMRKDLLFFLVNKAGPITMPPFDLHFFLLIKVGLYSLHSILN